MVSKRYRAVQEPPKPGKHKGKYNLPRTATYMALTAVVQDQITGDHAAWLGLSKDTRRQLLNRKFVEITNTFSDTPGGARHFHYHQARIVLTEAGAAWLEAYCGG